MTADAKTKPTAVGVAEFLNAVPDPRRREDGEALCALIAEATGLEPVMWGSSIVGFGRYRYVYDSGHSGEACLVGFSPRKANMVLYMAADAAEREGFLKRLGKHKTGKGCIYVNRLSDVDPAIVAEMARCSVRTLTARYPE